MKNRIVCLSLVVVFVALAIPIYAIIPGEDTVPAEQYAYYEYDFNTKETTLHYAPLDTTTTETWALFTEREVAEMTNSIQNASQIAFPTIIIGECDNRYPTQPSPYLPYGSVVFIECDFDSNGDGIGDKDYRGTGFMVSDKVVVSAGHTAYYAPYGTLVEMRVYPDVFDLNSKDEYVLASKQYYSYYLTSEVDSVREQYDYCVIELESAITRNFYFNCIQSNNIGIQTIGISGYPLDKGYGQWSSEGTIGTMDSHNLTYDNDTYGGMSGGPIYNLTYFNCLGVHTQQLEDNSANKGVLFFSQFYSLITQRINANQ